jgi:hypothetical protein
MTRIRSALLPSLVWLALTTLSSSAQTPGPVASASPHLHFTDPATGVSFDYPSVWKKVMRSDGFSPPEAFTPDDHLVVMVQFTGAENFYRHTDLEALDFLFLTAKETSAAACEKRVTGLNDDEHPLPPPQTINSVRFWHATGGEGSAGHSIDYEVYGTYRGGLCYLFEEDFTEASAGMIDGSRPLTKTERAALRRHLDAIIRTVRFTSKP